ncbi:protein ALTERED XYLOGLUCAN 4-like [Hordeum vulgare subsp. vulgare]|uniref:Trichome birefringence-like N-terminal domain-containing protein n=1 Tax=Hordeum vulgare subsp. vulgare TaxID=112509 RepID=A0A8I6YD26_HORVV|nr:protein ALTERED XYLOGLUCAN 4-like [Hordeum vulgare subsp. vulgare]
MGGTQIGTHGQCSFLKNFLTGALLTLPIVYILLYSTPSFLSCTSLLAAFQAHRSGTSPPQAWQQCDYTAGKWVWDDSTTGPRYDSQNCEMKSAEKCVINGKPDNGYLHWRWQPAGCNLSALDPTEFLRVVWGKRLAFVGDSTARNQAEALVCFLSTVSRPETTHRYDERLGRKFWRWVFPAPHNVEVSTYWSPFLVRGEGRSEDYGMTQDTVFLDALTEPWTADVDAMDVMVISAGHWFNHPAVYYDDGQIAGVFSRPDVNETDIGGGYVGAYRKAIRRALEYVNEKSSSGDRQKLVVVSTMASAHFDARYAWNHRDACSRPNPYGEGEAPEEVITAEMRKAVLEEAATAAAKRQRRGLRFDVLDVTRLASMRPDGHPGAYIVKGRYGLGKPVPETVNNDCLHWCSPGPVDTFNDILMQMLATSG